jgi:hypothetical protein
VLDELPVLTTKLAAFDPEDAFNTKVIAELFNDPSALHKPETSNCAGAGAPPEHFNVSLPSPTEYLGIDAALHSVGTDGNRAFTHVVSTGEEPANTFSGRAHPNPDNNNATEAFLTL